MPTTQARRYVRNIALLLLIPFSAWLSGCATTATLAGKDARLIEIGMPRSKVIAELGEPLEDVFNGDPNRKWNASRDKLGIEIQSSYELNVALGRFPAFKQADAYVFIDGYKRPAQMKGADAYYELVNNEAWDAKLPPFKPSAYGSHICIVTYDAADNVSSVIIFKKLRPAMRGH